MMRFCAVGFIFLWCCLIARAEEPAWKVSLPGWEYAFPRDHGSHPDFQTEWWYFTGNVTADDGSEFGYQLTFFRQGVIPPSVTIPQSEFVVRDVKFAHFAVSEISRSKFHHFQRLSRGSFGEAGFDDATRLTWIRDWTCELAGDNGFLLKAAEKGVQIELLLEGEKPPVFHGKDGISQKAAGEGRASHYYSLTRLKTKGTIAIEGKTYRVHGLSWFDHEWATNQLTADQVGWDWFSIQLNDGSELMLFQIRTKAGERDAFSSGTFVYPDGSARAIPDTDFTALPTAWWKSEKSGGNYPIEWKLFVPSLDLALTLRARFNEQELDAAPFAYWEGAIGVTGSRGAAQVAGKGYLEMTGYAGRIVGLQAK